MHLGVASTGAVWTVNPTQGPLALSSTQGDETLTSAKRAGSEGSATGSRPGRDQGATEPRTNHSVVPPHDPNCGDWKVHGRCWKDAHVEPSNHFFCIHGLRVGACKAQKRKERNYAAGVARAHRQYPGSQV